MVFSWMLHQPESFSKSLCLLAGFCVLEPFFYTKLQMSITVVRLDFSLIKHFNEKKTFSVNVELNNQTIVTFPFKQRRESGIRLRKRKRFKCSIERRTFCQLKSCITHESRGNRLFTLTLMHDICIDAFRCY